jgi:phosphoenolpyruvate carboxylase
VAGCRRGFKGKLIGKDAGYFAKRYVQFLADKVVSREDIKDEIAKHVGKIKDKDLENLATVKHENIEFLITYNTKFLCSAKQEGCHFSCRAVIIVSHRDMKYKINLFGYSRVDELQSPRLRDFMSWEEHGDKDAPDQGWV